MMLPTWLRPRRVTRKRNLVHGQRKRGKAVPRRLNVEPLERRALLSTVTILGNDLVSSAGNLEYYGVPGFVSLGTGNRSVDLGPGTYSVQNGSNGTFGTFTVSNQGTVAGATGALVATTNTIDFDLTDLAAVTVNVLSDSAGQLEQVTMGGVLGGTLNNPQTYYIPTGTYTLSNGVPIVYGTFTVADNGSGSFVVSSTTGALAATGNTISFDTNELAAIAINDVTNSAGELQQVGLGGVEVGTLNFPQTFYVPTGTYSLYTGVSTVYGSFTVAENGSGSFVVSGATGALAATGNTISFDTNELAAITINDLTDSDGDLEWVSLGGVEVGTLNFPQTFYVPSGTYSLYTAVSTVYGSFTAAENGAGTFVVSGTTGALAANGNTINFEDCGLNDVTITPNPGVGWQVGAVSASLAGPDTLFLPDGTYAMDFSGATGGAGPATFSVGADGLSNTELPANESLVSLQLTPCAPVLTSAAHASNGTTIAGTYMGRPNTTYQLDFYGDTSASPSGMGLGETLLGSESVLTDANGNATYTASVAALPVGETLLSATATDPNGNTSAFSHVVCLPPSALGTVYTVYTTADSGPGSLRQAILNADANATGTPANPDLIDFDIPTTDPGYQSSTGSFTIEPLSALPTITDTLVLDGYTQPGASTNTLATGDNAVLEIVLDGSQAGSVDGLVIGAGNCTVRGLVIDNFAAGSALVLNGSGNDVVTGNFIGTDVTGESAAPNNNGIEAESPGSMIGGTLPADRNIISGNDSVSPDAADGENSPSDRGIYLSNNGTLIQGNYIGSDKSGVFALPNG